jgi:hypothetical protein
VHALRADRSACDGDEPVPGRPADRIGHGGELGQDGPELADAQHGDPQIGVGGDRRRAVLFVGGHPGQEGDLAMVQGRAAADEVLVSRTVRDLLLGTSHTFEERGSYELKGIAGTWEVYAAAC